MTFSSRKSNDLQKDIIYEKIDTCNMRNKYEDHGRHSLFTKEDYLGQGYGTDGNELIPKASPFPPLS